VESSLLAAQQSVFQAKMLVGPDTHLTSAAAPTLFPIKEEDDSTERGVYEVPRCQVGKQACLKGKARHNSRLEPLRFSAL
jgi:hypothetical protein